MPSLLGDTQCLCGNVTQVCLFLRRQDMHHLIVMVNRKLLEFPVNDVELMDHLLRSIGKLVRFGDFLSELLNLRLELRLKLRPLLAVFRFELVHCCRFLGGQIEFFV